MNVLGEIRFAGLLLISLSATALVLSACGGGSNSSAVDTSLMPVAFEVLGQPDFLSKNANRGVPTNPLGFAQPLGGIATDGEHFYVADYGNNRILGWNSIPASSSTAPDFVLGQPDFTSNQPGTSATSLALPSSVQIANGKLVVADSGNNRVLIWNTLPTSGVSPDLVIGQTSFASSVSPTPPSAASLSFPVSAAIVNGRLFVSDQNNDRVLIWNAVPASNGAPADVVLGFTAFNDVSDANTIADDTTLNAPAGLWTDGFRLLVADSGNNRVMYWSQIPSLNGAKATNVIGQADFARVTSGVSAAQFSTPYSIASDGTQIYIADSNNNRVLKFDSFPIANGTGAIQVFGQNTFTARVPNDDNQDGTADTTPSARTMSSPTGVAVFNGVLYVTDRNNHRILLFPG
jgi:hypothetical protein